MRVAAAVIAAAVVLVAPARAGTTLTFLLAGQSNMAGHGAHPDRVGDRRVRVLGLDGKTWRRSAEPFPHGTGPGPGLSFGRRIARDRPGVTVRLIQCAIPGSPLYSWEPGGNVYEPCKTLIGRRHLDGVLFFQGESETGDAALAASWKSGFLSFVDGVRHDFGARLPVVYAQIGVYTQPYWDAVKRQQAAAQGARPLTAMIRTDDLPTDGEHFPVASYRTIGVRFAEAWEKLAKRR